MLVDGGAECTVDHADQAVLFRQVRRLSQIDDAQSRIGGRLQIQELRIRTDGLLMLPVIRGIDQGGFHTELRQPLREKLVCPAVNFALGNDVVARLEQGHEGRSDRAHAGRERQRGI